MITPDLIWVLLALISAGLFAGFVGGLFGVGGGTTIVPALYVVFEVLGLGGPYNLHVAIGTSLTIIIVTTGRSLLAHHAKGAVDFAILRRWAPWVCVGAVLGAVLARLTPEAGLGLIYGGFSLMIAAILGLLPEGTQIRQSPPTGWGQKLISVFIGGASAMMGVGGGAFGATTLSLCGLPIHRAVGTATGFGLATAIPSAILYIVINLDLTETPPLTVGAVNLPAVVLLAICTVTTAPVGARLAHSLPRSALRRAFAIYMILTAIVVFFTSRT